MVCMAARILGTVNTSCTPLEAIVSVVSAVYGRRVVVGGERNERDRGGSDEVVC